MVCPGSAVESTSAIPLQGMFVSRRKGSERRISIPMREEVDCLNTENGCSRSGSIVLIRIAHDSRRL